jgi:hypothetical protein
MKYVESRREMGNAYNTEPENLKERDHLGYIYKRKWEDNVKMNSREIQDMIMWVAFKWFRIGCSVGFCE